MSISYDDFTRRLKEERIRNQLTQRAMSKIVQMYPSHYCKVERDYNRFSFSELQNICTVEVDIYYLFAGKRDTRMNQYDAIFKEADV